MKKFLLLLLATYTLMANNLPQTIKTTVTNVNDNGELQLATSVPKGMSGIVVHNYGNGLSAITHSVISQGGSTTKVLPYTAISHDNIPTIKTAVQVNDKVILGNFYNNALLIAPNARTYANITKSLQKTWIHPDAYALELMNEGETKITLKTLHKFAKANQVGLVFIVTKNSLLILDPISKMLLEKQPFTGDSEKAMSPFFARFDQMDTSIFGLSKVDSTEYYQAVEGIQ